MSYLLYTYCDKSLDTGCPTKLLPWVRQLSELCQTLKDLKLETTENISSCWSRICFLERESEQTISHSVIPVLPLENVFPFPS